MSGILGQHDFSQVQLTINGLEITGKGSVSIERSEDVLTHSASADGQTYSARSVDKRMVATIVVMQSSDGAQTLGELFVEQDKHADGPTPVVNFFMRNYVTGESVKDDQAQFISAPTMEQTQETSEREFTILLPYGADNINYGDNE
jgi:hypothetical protein